MLINERAKGLYLYSEKTMEAILNSQVSVKAITAKAKESTPQSLITLVKTGESATEYVFLAAGLVQEKFSSLDADQDGQVSVVDIMSSVKSGLKTLREQDCQSVCENYRSARLRLFRFLVDYMAQEIKKDKQYLESRKQIIKKAE